MSSSDHQGDQVLERFLATFDATSGPRPRSAEPTPGDLLTALGGCSFNDGLYRVHTPESAARADELVLATFPNYRGRTACFGVDWLGRQYARDISSDQDPQLLRFDVGTGKVLSIPVPFSRFHDEEAVDWTEDCFSVDFFSEWRQSGGAAPGFDQCAGYRIPLFLGGEDDVPNLEISDLDVYWTLFGQLWRQVEHLPEGTPITQILGPENS